MKPKRCPKCGETDLEKFYNNKGRRNGKSAHCKQCSKMLTRQWQKNNPESVRRTRKKKDAQRRGTPKGKLSDNISRNMRETLRQGKSNRHWEELVGYTIDQLKNHLEKMFQPGMTWENYGTFWQIDHKIPLAVFNFEKPEDLDFRLCWSLRNLQPMEARANLDKRDKVYQPFQPSLILSL